MSPTAAVREFPVIVVWAQTSDLGIQRELESEFVEKGRAKGIRTWFIPASQHFYPGRTYTPEELKTQFTRLRATGVLFLTFGNSGTNQGYIPGSAYTYQGEAYFTAGQVVNKPWGNFNAQLYDCETEDYPWVASAAVSGGAYTTHRNVRKRFVKEILEELEAARFLRQSDEVSGSGRGGRGGGGD